MFILNLIVIHFIETTNNIYEYDYIIPKVYKRKHVSYLRPTSGRLVVENYLTESDIHGNNQFLSLEKSQRFELKCFFGGIKEWVIKDKFL